MNILCCNVFLFFRSIVPFWEELLVFNEDFEYILQSSPQVLILFEVLDFVNFTVASSQYRKLGKYILLQVVAFQNKSLLTMKIMECFSEFLLAVPFCLSLMFNRNIIEQSKRDTYSSHIQNIRVQILPNIYNFLSVLLVYLFHCFLKVIMFSRFILQVLIVFAR